MAAFEEGHKKLGGRKKGSLNKKTAALVPLLEQLKAHNFDIVGRLIETIPLLNPSEQVEALLRLMEFIFPKKRHTEISVDEAAEVMKNELEARGIDVDKAVSESPQPIVEDSNWDPA